MILDTLNQRIRRVSAGGTITPSPATGPPAIRATAAPRRPRRSRTRKGLAVDAQGAIAIADTTNERVRRVDTAGAITTIAGNGTFGVGGDGGEATAATLANPFDATIDAQGRIYIADTFNHRIRRVDLDGTITTVAGTGLSGFSGDGGPATAAELFEPDGVVLDAQGRIYIADTVNDRVRMVDTTGVITTIAGNGAPSVLDHPHGVAIDLQGRVVIADTYNHRIRRVDARRAHDDCGHRCVRVLGRRRPRDGRDDVDAVLRRGRSAGRAS